MKFAELINSTAFRLAAMFAGLFSAAVLLVFAVLYAQVGRDLEQQLAARLANDRSRFQLVLQRDGFNELSSLIADEASAASEAESVYLLEGPDGDYVAGNIKAAPPLKDVGWTAGEGLKGLPAGAAGHSYLASWTPLAGDGALLVGYSDAGIERTREVLLRTFAWGLAATLALAIGAGIFLGQRAQRQIDRIARALTAIRRGDLSARVPATAERGDIETVGRQINATLDQLQSLFHGVNQSSADIAHDLKTPIGRLRQRLEGLRDETASAPAIEAAIADIDSIVETFESLLNITQMEAGARRSRFRAVDLAEIVARVGDAYEAVAEDAGMSLSQSAPAPGLATVRGDSDLLSQMAVNLIENSIRHCPKGTRIALTAMETADGPRLVVADDGPGIPEDERDKVFRRLYRLEKSRTTPGSGLGLALVKAIVELHDGKIRLEDNRPGVRAIVDFPQGAPR